MSSRFSIVMLTYNNFDKFQRCIYSISPYFFDPDMKEIIILDNGSDGNLVHILTNLEKGIDKIKVIYSSKNLGVAGGRKILFDKAQGEYIISLDSDVVIQDHKYLLSALVNNLRPLPWESPLSSTGGEEKEEENNFYLIGGGGGIHSHYPSVFTHDVIHIPAREKKNEFISVGEVAGWCQCFRKSLLEKVKMDEIFSPFWGEDTDFCIQINNLGGKMAIFGKGVIQHSFSTCRDFSKKEQQDKQWEKVLNKWCPIDEYLDVEWYKNMYKTETPIQDYLSGVNCLPGILMGRLNFKILNYLTDTRFLDIWKIEQMLSLDNLIKLYVNIKFCSLNSSSSINIVNPEKLDMIETSEKLDNIILFMNEQQYSEIKVPKTLKQRKIVLDIDIPQDPYVLIMMAVYTLYSRDYDQINLIGYDLPEFNMKFNRKGIKKFVRDDASVNKDLNRISSFDYACVKKVVNSYPVENVLRAHLLFPDDYSNTWCPEYSPRHMISELFLRTYNSLDSSSEETGNNFLTIIINDGDIEELDMRKIREAWRCNVSKYRL